VQLRWCKRTRSQLRFCQDCGIWFSRCDCELRRAPPRAPSPASAAGSGSVQPTAAAPRSSRHHPHSPRPARSARRRPAHAPGRAAVEFGQRQDERVCVPMWDQQSSHQSLLFNCGGRSAQALSLRRHQQVPGRVTSLRSRPQPPCKRTVTDDPHLPACHGSNSPQMSFCQFCGAAPGRRAGGPSSRGLWGQTRTRRCAAGSSSKQLSNQG